MSAVPRGLVTVAVDYDRTLVTGSPPVWRRGAREFLVGAAVVGARVVLHSVRATPPADVLPGDAEEFFLSGRAPAAAEERWRAFDEMRAFLQAEGVWQLLEVWQAPGKPLADRFVDDKAVEPDFAQILAELGVRLGG